MEAWEQSPIVSYIRLANPEIGVAELLCEHHRIQCELEDIFPGMSFAEIFRSTTEMGEDRNRVRRAMLASGVEAKTVTEILGKAHGGDSSAGGKKNALVNRFKGYESQARLADLDLSFTELKQRGLSTTAAITVRKFKKPLGEKTRRYGERANDETDLSWKQIADQEQTTKQNVSVYARVVRYQRERGIL